jgi:cytochrome b pre-mRNA-processing protein 3
MLSAALSSFKLWLHSRSPERATAKELYGAIVSQARQPAFYARQGVPDTPDGRYEVIVLHLFLVLERLKALGEPGRVLSQNLIETFVEDMDDSMREMGVGDLTVPRKVKKAAAGLWDRAEVYRQALTEPGDARLSGQLRASIPSEPGRALNADALARYVRACAAHLAHQPAGDAVSGRMTFPAVE